MVTIKQGRFFDTRICSFEVSTADGKDWLSQLDLRRLQALIVGSSARLNARTYIHLEHLLPADCITAGPGIISANVAPALLGGCQQALSHSASSGTDTKPEHTGLSRQRRAHPSTAKAAPPASWRTNWRPSFHGFLAGPYPLSQRHARPVQLDGAPRILRLRLHFPAHYGSDGHSAKDSDPPSTKPKRLSNVAPSKLNSFVAVSARAMRAIAVRPMAQGTTKNALFTGRFLSRRGAHYAMA